MNNASGVRSKFSYGWVIVTACALMMANTYGLIYSYSVFFKPLADYFNWDRASVSLIYSASLIIRGAVAIGTGWLADKYGARKIMLFCGFMIGLGLILSSQVHNLWQLFITYALVEAIGLSGSFGIGTSLVSRWFTGNRGLALGLVATGSGWGTLIIVPGCERLINALDWSQAFMVCGMAAGILMIGCALVLRPAPQRQVPDLKHSPSNTNSESRKPSLPADFTLKQAVKDSRMLLLMGSFIFFFFSAQIIMVHLVNYATDVGINPLAAASLISIIGAISIAGRLGMGIGAERMGIHNTLIFTRVVLVISFICLVFTRSLWAFYLFAVLFGIPYGGEIPQIPLYIGRYFGTKVMATLIGISTFVMTLGGAMGSWAAGKIFDTYGSYQWAFIAGGVSGLFSLILILLLWMKNKQQTPARQRISGYTG